MQNSEDYMRLALKEAAAAAAAGEIPVGAVIVRDGQVIAAAHNSTETDKDPTAHAEIKAIRQAAAALGGWRLTGCDMYVTTEPCSMCAGAIVLARIRKLCIGTEDPKAGACVSLSNIVTDPRLNHQVELELGVLQPQCARMLKDFFRQLRADKKEKQSED